LSVLYGRPAEAFVLFGFLAAVTQRVELVTSVVILPQRQTALVAKQAAAVDVLSRGRLRLGVGGGRHRPPWTGAMATSKRPGAIVPNSASRGRWLSAGPAGAEGEGTRGVAGDARHHAPVRAYGLGLTSPGNHVKALEQFKKDVLGQISAPRSE
jgi:alkanesulfonate monooxygenase SsuD/methylene tetrahydromethanopterin reductase-like flavin-dependent oxidoreductase (luciferase family)